MIPNNLALIEYYEHLINVKRGYDPKTELDHSICKFKFLDIKEKIKEILDSKITSLDVINEYKSYLLTTFAIDGINNEDKENGKRFFNLSEAHKAVNYGIVLHSWQTDNNIDDLEMRQATDIASSIFDIVVGVCFAKELKIEKDFMYKIINLKRWIKELNNPLIKENLLIDGSGWKSVFKTYSIDSPLENHRLAALITLVSDKSLISTAYNQDWLVPHFDVQAGFGNEVLYEELVMAFKHNDIMANEEDDLDKCLEYLMKLSRSLTFEKICKIKEIIKGKEQHAQTD